MRSKQGISILEVVIVVAIAGIVAAVAVPNMLKSKMGKNEQASLGTLRAILDAEEVYFNRHGAYGTLVALAKEDLIPRDVASGQTNGYFFGVYFPKKSPWKMYLGAVPVSESITGSKEFSATMDGAIYETDCNSSRLAGALKKSYVDDWSRQSTLPPEFVATPERHEAVWTPVQ